ncbi:transmembrane protein 209-like [Oppia nitens]|uniref:transmembrane protein 209-like n=1 Tax=Oppia nitens TaxID=1686743 RepID=UPI0023DA8D4B|nr:transmembrane protein 209-like [Oppia nitens]
MSASMDQLLKRRQLLTQSRQSFWWAIINGTFAAIVAIDYKYHIVGQMLLAPDLVMFNSLIQLIDIFLMIILMVNTVYEIYVCIWRKYLMKELEFSPSQLRAFAIRSDEIGFKPIKPVDDNNQKTTKATANNNNTTIDDSIAKPIFEMSALSDISLDRHSSLNSIQLSDSLNCTQFDSSVDVSSKSWQWMRPSSRSSTMSSSQLLSPRQSLINNEKRLSTYLTEFEQQERRLDELAECLASSKNNNNGSQQQSYNWSLVGDDNSGSSVYQLAVASPLHLNDDHLEDNDQSGSASKLMDSILIKFKIDETIMNQWIENLRKWISLTILSRVVQQIDKLNDLLAKNGHSDTVIGQSNIQVLKRIISLKNSKLYSLETFLPFLELNTNQQYLVQRIKELSRGGSINQFKWNSGGYFNLKLWNDELVTDSAIIMHLFCTYMDMRLPSNPNCPDGKTFTNVYFKSLNGNAPNSPIYIVECKSKPPHYKLFTKNDDLWELPVGRNNLFHSIISFIYSIKTQHFGHLGRVNLGSSGINILWVIDQ